MNKSVAFIPICQSIYYSFCEICSRTSFIFPAYYLPQLWGYCGCLFLAPSLVSTSKFIGPYNTNYCQMFAVIMVAVIPTIIVYCAFSNQIVDGLTAGAVKG